MKFLAYLFLIGLVPVSAAANDFWMLAKKCELESENYDIQKIHISIYSSRLDRISQDIQLVYYYPEVGGEDFSFMSLFRAEEDGIYQGKLTNIDFLVDADLDIFNGSLNFFENGELVEFKGTCY